MKGVFSVLLPFIVNQKNIIHEWMSTSRNVDHVQKQPPNLSEERPGPAAVLLTAVHPGMLLE